MNISLKLYNKYNKVINLYKKNLGWKTPSKDVDEEFKLKWKVCQVGQNVYKASLECQCKETALDFMLDCKFPFVKKFKGRHFISAHSDNGDWKANAYRSRRTGSTSIPMSLGLWEV